MTERLPPGETPDALYAREEEPVERIEPIEERRPPAAPVAILGWARANLFSGVANTILTLACLAFLVWSLPPVIDWFLTGAVWTGTDPAACEDASGACWALIDAKHRFILFGLYPYGEQWRPALAVALFVALIAVSCYPKFWRPWVFAVWGVGLLLCGLLMWGGVLGMTFVSTDQWGGLPLTLVLAVVGMIGSFPLAILLALGRRSELPAFQAVSTGFIELIRGVPLISVLFMASVMFPLFLPEGLTVNKLLRAQVGIILFTAAYLAEGVRGGLQAVPRGQYEAADALGLGYWQKMGLIVLPQALKVSIPALVNQFISMFKDTSLVIVIGLYDLLNTAKISVSDPAWRAYFVEAYAFAALIYFLFCFFMSRYSLFLESRLGVGRKR